MMLLSAKTIKSRLVEFSEGNMCGKSVRLAALIGAVLILLTTAAFAQANADAVWPGYHGFSQRAGQNPDATHTANPGNLTLIWTYPRTPQVPASDSMISNTRANYTGTWNIGTDPTTYDTVPGGPPQNFQYIKADVDATATATWEFPSNAPESAPAGRYRVYVRSLSPTDAGLIASTGAVYTVVDRNRSYRYTVNQTADLGKWVQIGGVFEFEDNTQYVELSARTEDSIISNVVVMANAVRFVRDQSTPEIVMDDNSSTGFTDNPAGSWSTGSASGNAGLVSGSSYDGGFHYKPTADATASVSWTIPTGTPSGKYLLYAWFPSTYENNPVGYTNTTAAVYSAGGINFTVDQSDPDSGGMWKLLSDRPVILASGNTISLSNQTADSTATTIVVADAVKIVPATGAEFFASPVAGEVPVDWDFGGDGAYNALVPVVYSATVEPPFNSAAENPLDTGSIVCANGVTPELSFPAMPATLVDRLKENLGTALWTYPNGSPSQRAPNEGPVQGGFYSTPTLTYYMDNSVNPAVRRTALVATGMDGQIYALDAEGIANSNKSITERSPKLLWKGPGITESEPYAAIGPYANPNPALWQSIAGRTDAFGGTFLYAACAPSGAAGAPVRWIFDDTKRAAIGEPTVAGEGWAYDVSVWIPAVGNTVGGLLVSPDAVYKITYVAPDDANAEQTVTVSLRESKNQGRWVSLGNFFNVKQVELTNATKQANPTDYAVIADACMIVPEQMPAFGYSSPVTDIQTYGNNVGSDNAHVVYATTSLGRVMSINMEPSVLVAGSYSWNFGRINWFFPSIRSKLVSSGSADETKSGLGPVIASSTYVRNPGGASRARLLVATTDEFGGEGNVYCLTDIEYNMGTNPTLDWRFPAAGITTDNDRPTSFSSSPAVAGNRVYIGSEYGSVFALNLDKAADGVSQAAWKYPASDTELPLGAFRYSTPAVATVDGVERAWIGSADGKVYSFNTGNVPDSERLMATTGSAQFYSEPNTRSAIFSSVALDGRNALTKPEIAYVGTMANQGILRWYLARSGLVGSGWSTLGWPALGQIFASPAPAQTMNRQHLDLTQASGTTAVDYVYFTASDGRIYALSSKVSGGGGGAWGGEWSGGGWLYDSEPGTNPLVEVQPTSEGGDIQFELIQPQFYNNTFTANPEPRDAVNAPNPLTADADWDNTNWLVRRNMKLVDPATVTAGADLIRNQALSTLLTQRARAVRDLPDMLFDTRANRLANRPLYVEWGETLHLALWNLNPDELKSGQSSISIQMHNGSAGSSAGMEITAKVKVYREYTVLDQSKTAGTGYEPFKYFGSQKNVRRAYMLAQIDLKATGSKPPSPGPGWEIYAKVTKTSGDETIDLAKLVTVAGIPVPKMETLTDPDAASYASGDNLPATQYKYDKLKVGINNPLAIRDDGSGRDPGGQPNTTFSRELAWGIDRNDRHAHFNGNSWVDPATGDYSHGRSIGHLPVLWVRNTPHGATTAARRLGIADRSASGAHTTPQQISNFRISTWDLAWNGGEAAIASKAYPSVNAPAYGMKFPWEYGIGSIDYPDILTRYQQFRTTMDGKDPVRAQTQLPSVLASSTNPERYDDATLRPDQVEVTVDVPRFQPANTFNDGLNVGLPPRGYSRVMTAYVDSNRNGGFDNGAVRLGRPTTYQEAYRNFRYDLTVAPDPKIEVKETTVDVGLAPHGLGVNMGWDFSAFTSEPFWTNSISKWFKTLTVRNLGNVNLYRLRVDKNTMLIGDGARYPIMGENITSSLDKTMLGTGVEMAPPVTTANLGYTLTKARVADPDPTTLTIPDRRKWNMMNSTDKATAQGLLRGEAPVQPMISVRVPLSQPVGTYVARGVRVYSDMADDDQWYRGERDWNGNGLVDPAEDRNGNGIIDAEEPSTNPSIDLKVSVRENQMTGGTIATTLTQIDDDVTSRVGDGGPAAFRDPGTGRVVMFWPSNRRSDPPSGALYPDWSLPTDSRIVDFSRAPWFINQAVLDTNAPDPAQPWRTFWRPSPFGAGMRWWDVPNPYEPLPSFQWPDVTAVPFWRFAGADTDLRQVKHTSPAVAVNPDNGHAYLAWAGSAEITSGTNRTSEDRIFFTEVTGGQVNNLTTGNSTVSSMIGVTKRSPSLAAWGAGAENLLLFWQGMVANRWGIYFNSSSDGTNWTSDAKVRVSDGLAIVGNPNIVHRQVNYLDGGGTQFTSDLLDMVYDGTGKVTRNSDILLSRYVPTNQARSMISPTRRALPLPRVYAERLSYVSKYGFYTSEHNAWIRLDTRFDTPVPDSWVSRITDLPFIRVILGDGYVQPAGTVISVTDGSVDGIGGVGIRPKVDPVSGVYVYEYVPGSVAYDVLGKAFIDYSEGVIKFTRPLKNASAGSGAAKPEVYASYTPQSWRLTTDLHTDSSPRAFIERTPMTIGANPGMGSNVSASVDRLWVMWRKAPAGIKGNLIYYKTYRMGIDLKNIAGAVPIKMNSGEYDPYGFVNYGDAYPFTNDGADKNLNGVRDRSGSTWAAVTINGIAGQFEVDATGTKIFLNQVDERYPAMDRLATRLRNAFPVDPEVNRLGQSPGPMSITYTDVNGDIQTIEADTVFWVPEIEEQSLTGATSTVNVNEGSIWAFADPEPPAFILPGETSPSPLSKIWLFWTSTRDENTDLFWETVYPGLTVK